MKILAKRKELFFSLLRRAVSSAGSFDPDECLFYVEEEMTIDEGKAAQHFLRWCVENKRTFGHNLPVVFAEYEKGNK